MPLSLVNYLGTALLINAVHPLVSCCADRFNSLTSLVRMHRPRAFAISGWPGLHPIQCHLFHIASLQPQPIQRGWLGLITFFFGKANRTEEIISCMSEKHLAEWLINELW